ncbi:hypothetical protein HYALB_00010576 [Hymenoscyphus albidus]|uniref:Uncharacterized protein n=1 Tax=Hymenoscyphus albidus TaxID=595503 RepID=A0A9N9PQD3_9HELO|nr:hypothetical protein HYALB_00010576 [Hymenoscyphus albidus]
MKQACAPVNIWSHLLGGLMFATLPIFVYITILPRYDNARTGDIIVFSKFFFGVAICFFLSAYFHVVANHSEKVAAFGNQLDYLGVVVLMWGSTIPSVYYGFYCNARLQKIYWSVSFVTYLHLNDHTADVILLDLYIGSGMCSNNTKPEIPSSLTLSTSRGDVLRAWSFGNCIYHTRPHYLRLGDPNTKNESGLDGIDGFTKSDWRCNLCFSTKCPFIPERWYPMTHDIFGTSHQILHFMVIFAGLAHMVGLLKAFGHLHSQQSPCP